MSGQSFWRWFAISTEALLAFVIWWTTRQPPEVKS